MRKKTSKNISKIEKTKNIYVRKIQIEKKDVLSSKKSLFDYISFSSEHFLSHYLWLSITHLTSKKVKDPRKKIQFIFIVKLIFPLKN